jgi:hypothetical protein
MRNFDVTGLPSVEHWLALGDGGDLSLGFSLTDDQAEQYRREPRAVIEQLTGVSLETWLAWRSAGGRPPCGATMVSGRSCRGYVSTVLKNPAAWHAYGHGYCSVHGGGHGR